MNYYSYHVKTLGQFDSSSNIFPEFKNNGDSSNGFFNNDAPTLTVGATVKVAILSIMALASLIGNSATLFNIIRSKEARTNRSSLYKLLIQVWWSHFFFFQNIGFNKWYILQWKAGCCGPFGQHLVSFGRGVLDLHGRMERWSSPLQGFQILSSKYTSFFCSEFITWRNLETYYDKHWGKFNHLSSVRVSIWQYQNLLNIPFEIIVLGIRELLYTVCLF